MNRLILPLQRFVATALVFLLAACSGASRNADLPVISRDAALISNSGIGSIAPKATNMGQSAISENVSSPSALSTYKGCNVFAPGGYYNSDITYSSVDSHSSNYLSSLMATDNTGFYASSGLEPINVASSSTAKYSVKPKVAWHSFPAPYPYSTSFKIEPAGDAHLVVLLATPPSCHLYEAYSSSFSSNVLSAYSGANWDLSQPYKITQSSAMASGLSLFAGSVRHEELATGVKHALNFTVFSQAACNCYVAPASGTDGVSYSGPSTAYQIPYGAHLRLKSSFADSGFGPQSKAIAEALKHYGMYLADSGGHYVNNNALYLADPTDGGSWNASDLRALSGLRFSDFDVLNVGPITKR